MTVSGMHQAFKIGYDKLDSLNYPDILPEEIDFLLNQAQDRFVKQRYGTTNPKKQSFEETQKRTDDLKALVKNVIIVPSANTSGNIDPNAQFCILPSDYWFAVQERVDLQCLNCNNAVVTSRVSVKAIEHDDFDNLTKDPFNRPNSAKVLRLMAYGKAELIHDDNSTITNYYLRYIKEPIRIDITIPTDCELSPETHSEIVSEAISIALESVEAMRTKTFDPIIKNTEE